MELAIPLIALGGLFVVSNQKKRRDSIPSINMHRVTKRRINFSSRIKLTWIRSTRLRLLI